MKLGQILVLAILVALVPLAGCAPVGSERWCNKMKEKDKGDWTASEAADFAKHCLFK